MCSSDLDLADRVGLAKTTVHGLLRTLQEHGLVEQHAESDKYQLGPELLQLGNSYLDLNELRSHALAWSEQLAMQSGEAVRVGVPHSDAALVVIGEVVAVREALGAFARAAA